MKKKLELLEKYAIIFGALLGVVAFAWQVVDAVDKQKEKVFARLSCIVWEHEPDQMQFYLEIVNIGQRPIYIETVHFYISEGDSSFSIDFFSGEEVVKDQPIPPGAARKYSNKLSRAENEIKVTQQNTIYLVIESPTSVLVNQDITSMSIGDFNNIIQNIPDDLEDGVPVSYGCGE